VVLVVQVILATALVPMGEVCGFKASAPDRIRW